MTDELRGLVPWTLMGQERALNARGIPLRRRDGAICAVALVDEADFAALGARPWCLNSHGYAQRRKGSRWVRMHREILRLSDSRHDADHINRDRLDNRRANLRVTTRAQNRQNTRGWEERSTSRHRGVCWDAARGKWRAQVTIGYRNHFVGRFATEQLAADAAAKFRRQHMPFATD